MNKSTYDTTKQIMGVLAETLKTYSNVYKETNLTNARQFLEFFMDINRKCISAVEGDKMVGVPIDLHTDIHTTDHLPSHKSTDTVSLASILRFITKEQRKELEKIERIVGKKEANVGTVEDSILRALQKASMKAEIIYSEIIQKQY